MPDDDSGSCCSANHIFDRSSPLFAPERAAIAADAQLLARIVARAVGNLRIVCKEGGLSSDAFDITLGGCDSVIKEGGLASLDRDTYTDGAAALRLLGTYALLAATTNHAHTQTHDDFQFVEVLIIATGLFLRLDPPPELGPQRHASHLFTLASAVSAMYITSMVGDLSELGLVQVGMRDRRRCLALAATVGVRFVESGVELPLALAHNIVKFMKFMFLTTAGSLPTDLPLVEGINSWAPHYQALEGVLRLAALLPASRPGEDSDTGSETPLESLHWWGEYFLPLYLHKPPGEQAGVWNALPGLVGSAAKFALRLAPPGAEAEPREKLRCLSAMVDGVELFYRELEGGEQQQGFPLR